ncbi:EamA family transporter [Agrobacterium rhizogenes]|nr:EamA family transporter [Rhizobium rhizogenes]NTG58099.1 EamA family transporter [Rhizobium rhizogenes]
MRTTAVSSGAQAWASPAIVGALTCSALGAALGKGLFAAVGPEGVTALRLGFSALLLMVIGRPWRKGPQRAPPLAIIGFGVSLGLMNILIYQAFARLPLGVAAAVEVTGPLLVALAHSRRSLDFLWLATAVGGLLFLLPLRTENDLDPVGLLFAAGAAACWACYILFGKKISPLGPARAVSLGMAVAATFGVPFGVYNAGASLLGWQILAVGLLVALRSSAIPYMLEMFAFRRLPPSALGILLSAAPAISALMGTLLLNERLSNQQMLSIVLIMVGSAGCAIFSRKAVA